MPRVIAEPCIGVKDKACVEVCPFDCIHSDNNSVQLYVDPRCCTDCGACEPECPVDAIYMNTYLPLKWKHYEQINADYFKDK